LREAIAEELGLDTYEGLGRVSRMMAEVYELLVEAHNDVDVGRETPDRAQTGLAAAVVRAWHDGGEDLSGLETVDPSTIEPMQSLPWREWAAWSQREERGGQTGDDEDAGKEAAYAVLDEFMGSSHEWRQDILDSYTLVHEGTPVGLYAIDAAAALIEQVLEVPDEELDHRLEGVLSARGFYGVYGGAPSGLRQSLAREVAPEKLRLDGWMLKRHRALLERIAHGRNVLQVRELREHFRWLAPELVDGAYEDGPCMWQVLAHLNDDAYVEVEEGGSDEEEPVSITPFATVYVEREEDIAATLRCTGTGGTRMHIVTRGEALKEGLPQLAGWYAIRWWD
jgi:hypothetical protein